MASNKVHRSDRGEPPPSGFATTRWSAVLAAGAQSSDRASEALSGLCESYWYPLYAYVRRRGFHPEHAQDLTQGFFAQMLEKNGFADADPNRGRFRSFLLGCLKNYLSHETERAQTQKRGGGRNIISFELTDAEGRYQLEPAHELTAEKLFDRRWALLLLDRVLTAVRAEYESAGKHELFDALKATLTHTSVTAPYDEIAKRLSMTSAAVKVSVHRLRKRYRELLRSAVADCVVSEADVDAEIRDLFNVFDAS